MLPLALPYLAIGALGIGAWWAKKRRDTQATIHGEGGYGVLTPERQAAYEVAMNEAKDADKIDDLANEFDKAGLKDQAMLLHKRAKLRRLPKEVKEQRRAIYKKALQSTNKQAVLDVAKSFQMEGCAGTAKKLYEYAQGLP